MEGLRFDSAAARYIAPRLGDDRFTVIDVGSSGGIDPIWRLFGAHLRAFGFDPDVDDCARLNAAETLAGIRYLPAFVGVPADHAIVQRRLPRPHIQRNPWNRLSVAQTLALRQARAATAATSQGPLADAAATVVLPDFFRAHAVDDIDVVKIDVDGADFDILQSLADSLGERRVLAAGLEVNFIGSHEETDHTFHNTDRFMRSHGFDLFRLTVRPYSASALPAPYPRNHPGPSVSGRPLQGDALYVRDLGNPEEREAVEGFSPLKLARLCAIYSCFGLYDCAAEVLLTHRPRIGDLLDVDYLLNILCAEAQGTRQPRLSYPEYMAAFERDEPLFYGHRQGAAHS